MYMTFKDEINLSLNTEIEADQFVMNTIARFQQAIRESIAAPGVSEYVIMRVSETEPMTENQISKVKMACIKHIGVSVDVSTWEMIVRMEKFLN